MTDKVKKLPDFELEAMLVIWHGEQPLHTGEILRQMTTDCCVQALQSVLRRLEGKGFVACEKIGRLNYYTPLVKEEAYRGQETMSMLDRLYSNSPVRLIASLVENVALSEQDWEEIRRILERR